MNDDGLGSIVVTRNVVHGGIVVKILVGVWVSASLPGESSCSIGVHGRLLLCIETLFMLKSKCETLVISFEELAADISQQTFNNFLLTTS